MILLPYKFIFDVLFILSSPVDFLVFRQFATVTVFQVVGQDFTIILINWQLKTSKLQGKNSATDSYFSVVHILRKQ